MTRPRYQPTRCEQTFRAIADFGAMLAVMYLLALLLGWCSPKVYGECHIDPATGLQVCSFDQTPARRVTAFDNEAPPVPGASAILDNGTCTLIYDDGQRAIVLTCWHNLRNTSPPYRVQVGNAWREARIIDQDPEDELAALELAGNTGIPPVPIFDGELPHDVRGCGYGGQNEGYQFASVDGQVTDTPYTHDGFRGFSGQVRQGDSGGPVLTRDGRLVGVLWGNNVENREVMFTCNQPFRRFLDRILPGRPGVIIPHAQYPGQPTRLPRIPPPVPRPGSIVDAPPARVTPPVPAAPAVPPLVVASPLEQMQKSIDGLNQKIGSLRAGPPGPPGKDGVGLPGPQGPAADVDTTKFATHDELGTLATTVETKASQWLIYSLLGALGISGGIAPIAAYFGSKLAVRGIKQLASRVRSDAAGAGGPATGTFQKSFGSFPVAIDTPPPPQNTVIEQRFVPYETDTTSKAHAWADEQLVRKYPGSVEYVNHRQSLVKQFLAGAGVPNGSH